MRIETEADLAALYAATPAKASTIKVARHLTPAYRAWIEAAPFCALATVGPEGLDCSPRGDLGRVTEIVDERTLALPDRRGNNRIDSLTNIIRDPRVALMYLIPGSGTVIRVNGRAEIHAGEVCAAYTREGAAPRTVILIRIDEVYFQCARAVLRADIWKARPDLDALPSVGQILEEMSAGGIDGKAYDTEWPARAKTSMW